MQDKSGISKEIFFFFFCVSDIYNIFLIHMIWLFGNTILLETLQNLLSFSHLTHITFEIILDWFYYNTKTHEWGKKASV